MSEKELTPEQQAELNQFATVVAQSLARGESQQEVTDQLVSDGWDQEGAAAFVHSVAQQVADGQSGPAPAASGGGGGGSSWLVWIGILVLVNLLSYVFNWPFWIY